MTKLYRYDCVSFKISTSIVSVFFIDFFLCAGNAQTSNVFPLIDASSCSFPFTLNGVVWYGCIIDITIYTGISEQANACFMANRTGAKCNTTAANVARTVDIYVDVVNQTSVNTLSVAGWIVWMQRVDLTFSWATGWADYKNGFGSVGSNFWLGLERVHLLTTSTAYRLRIEVQQNADGRWYSAEYWSFWIDDEITQYYQLNVAGYSGDAGDSLQYQGGRQGGDNGQYYQNGMNFTTYDNDNDPSSGGNMASVSGGGWWYNAKYWSCATCAGSNAQWCTMPGGCNLKTARMMIKPQSA